VSDRIETAIFEFEDIAELSLPKLDFHVGDAGAFDGLFLGCRFVTTVGQDEDEETSKEDSHATSEDEFDRTRTPDIHS